MIYNIGIDCIKINSTIMTSINIMTSFNKCRKYKNDFIAYTLKTNMGYNL